MRMILEAIKALLRGLERKIPKSLTDLLRGEKIPGQMVQDMYYRIPAEYEVAHPRQAYAMTEALDSEYNNYVRDDQPTYGVNFNGLEFLGGDYAGILGASALTVEWNGVEYQCKKQVTYDWMLFGNRNIFDPDAHNTGEPFLIAVKIYEDGEGGFGGYLNIRTSAQGEHTVQFGPTIKAGHHQRMAREFLPETVESDINTAKGMAQTAVEDAVSAQNDARSAYNKLPIEVKATPISVGSAIATTEVSGETVRGYVNKGRLVYMSLHGNIYYAISSPDTIKQYFVAFVENNISFEIRCVYLDSTKSVHETWSKTL